MERKVLERLTDEGYQPLPLVKGQKRPALKQWTNKRFALDELYQYDLTRIALRTGDNGLEAIDVDSKNAEAQKEMNFDFLRRIKEAGIDDNLVSIQKTASDGVHIIYRTDTPRGNTKIAKSLSGDVLVETRGMGGCIVVYDEEILEDVLDLPILTKTQRDALWAVAASFDCGRSKIERGSFEEYNTNNYCLDILLHRGWREVDRNGSIVKVLRSGNPSSTSSGSIFLDSNRAYVFSTSAGLPSEETLSPAALTCYLDYKGDWSSFSRALNLTKPEGSSFSQIPSFKNSPTTFSELLEQGAKLPPTIPLLGSLIFEGEFTIFFGRTNVGKTVAGVQIALAISKGETLWDLENKGRARNVLYLDFELSQRQLVKRYGALNPPENFFYTITPEFNEVEEIESWRAGMLHFIEEQIKRSNAEVVFLDNISALQSDSSKAEDAVELVQKIKFLKEKLGITFIVVGHPTKQAKETPMDINHLSGSSKLAALADAVFGMNFSNEGTGARYIMALKTRSSEMEYGPENVIKLELSSPNGYPELLFTGFDQEWKLLKSGFESKDERDSEILRLNRDGLSYREIAEMLGIGKTTVGEVVTRSVRPNDELDNTDRNTPPF